MLHQQEANVKVAWVKWIMKISNSTSDHYSVKCVVESKLDCSVSKKWYLVRQVDTKDCFQNECKYSSNHQWRSSSKLQSSPPYSDFKSTSSSTTTTHTTTFTTKASSSASATSNSSCEGGWKLIQSEIKCIKLFRCHSTKI